MSASYVGLQFDRWRFYFGRQTFTHTINEGYGCRSLPCIMCTRLGHQLYRFGHQTMKSDKDVEKPPKWNNTHWMTTKAHQRRPGELKPPEAFNFTKKKKSLIQRNSCRWGIKGILLVLLSILTFLAFLSFMVFSIHKRLLIMKQSIVFDVFKR